jgi:tetratricopeptide (TPR) repeat protein
MRVLNCLSLVALLSVALWGSESQSQGCQIQVSLTGQAKIPKDVKLYLYRDGRVLEKLKVKSDGRVNLPDLPVGDYQMLVSSGDMSIAGSRNVHLDPTRGDCHETLVVQRSQGTVEKSNSPEPISSAELSMPEAGREAFRSAMLDLRDGKSEQAKTEFLALTKKYPRVSQPYNNLGVIAAQQGDFAGAEKYFEAAIEANPHNTAALTNLAKEMVRRGDYSSSLMLIDRCTREGPPNAELFMIKAWAHQKMGRFDEVIADARELHRLPHKGMDEVHILAGVAYETKGQFDAAIREYQLYLSESSNDDGRTKATARVNTLLHAMQTESADALRAPAIDGPPPFASFVPKK